MFTLNTTYFLKSCHYLCLVLSGMFFSVLTIWLIIIYLSHIKTFD